MVVTSTDRRGAEVEGSQLASELTALGVPTEVVALAPGRVGGLEVPTLGAAPRALATLRALRRKAKGVDVVVAYGSTALPACVIALAGTRVPFVYRSIGDPARWVRGGVHRWRTGVLFRRAAHVVALWPAAAESITSLYRVPSDRVSCIPNARPLPSADEPDRATARAQLGLPADATVVAWAGAFSPEKRPVLAVEAVAEAEGAWLALAGNGPLEPDVAAACARLLPERHRLIGRLQGLDPLWAAADVVLLTSSTEGMPGVLIEAALRGLPAVATDVGAVREVVGEGGAVVPVDAAAVVIGEALSAVLAGATVADRIRTQAATRFVWGVVAPAWMAVLGHQRDFRPLASKARS